ncbi:MAG: YdcF family protein [Proteobacteria bacterium]|nr:YdcF family protein [Pseudomonadota bacterium]
MQKKKRVGVLIHGYHLQAKNWENIVWGEPPLMGRLPKGTAVALETEAEVVVFGTGASEKGGKKEAEVIRDYLFEHFFELEKFSAFNGLELEEDIREAERRMREKSVIEIKSQNTFEEVKFAGEIFKNHGIERAILVSSPAHISRCLKYAYAVFSEEKELRYLTQELYATPSQVCYPGYKVEDVIVMEPPHRPDRPYSLYPCFKRMMNMPEEKLKELLNDLEPLLRKYTV